MKLIVGLGNPGEKYTNNRHNVGFKVIDEISKRLNINVSKEKFGGLYGDGLYKEEKIILLKPMTYINLSGEVIRQYIAFYKINIDDILIISDDLDIELGGLKLKQSGGSGGHNGLKNIELHLETDNYKRLKIGISKDKTILTKDYVLGNFTENEQNIINKTIERAADICIDFITIEFMQLMNKYNTKEEII